MVAGWLFPLRSLPVFSFSQEWISCAAFFLLAVYFYFKEKLAGNKHLLERIPHVTVVMAGIPLIGVLQIILGLHPLPIGVGFFVCGFLAFSFASQLGLELIKDIDNSEKNIKFLNGFAIICKWILGGGFLSALMVFLQLLNWDIYLFPLVRSPSLFESRPSANLSQPNLMTLHLVFAIVSAGWLYVEKKISPYKLAGIVFFISIAIGFANTRAFLLMMGAVTLGVLFYRGPKKRTLLIWTLFILPGLYLFLAHYNNELMSIFGYGGRATFDINIKTDARIKIWMASLEIVKLNPFLGVGLGAYSVGFFEVAQGTLGSVGATGNAHNLTLQLMAECGIFFGLAFSLGIGCWYFKRLFQPNLKSWQLASISIIGAALAHSLVEFPLWFFSFLVPVAFFSGLLSSNAAASIVDIKKSARAIIFSGVATLAMVGLIWSLVDYIDLQENYEDGITIGNSNAVKKVASQNRTSLFQWHYDYGRFLTMELEENNSELIMDLARKSVQRFPFIRGVARYSYVAAATNHMQEADSALRVLYNMYPVAFETFLKQNHALCIDDATTQRAHCILEGLAGEIKITDAK